MAEYRLSGDQFSALVQEVTKAVLVLVAEQPRYERSAEVKVLSSPEARSQRGRPKSVCTGQLHMKVLQEDELWFKSLAKALEIQNGKLLNLLRRNFEEREGGLKVELHATELAPKV
ncbi:hypothetical protein K3555_15975 [Leisingera sp. M527]|uniref:hypothetical protein n=1 Tax=Leisingera sp. M527 TaxID=2867014 RepID=UPI0021A6E3F8|nr:hypothetical protein [Leisingera sp. M527]UWQ32061.1 hypothetical protein K3555_15975 [Leisingera sp. M527]